MLWYLLIGVFLSGWSMLLVLAGERQRRIQDLQARQQQIQAEKNKPAPEPEIPTVG